MNNGRNLYDFDGVIYKGNCSFDFFMFCLKYYPCILKYIPSYILDYMLIKNNLIDFSNNSYDFCRFLYDVKDLDKLILDFWNEYYWKINEWYKKQMKCDDLVISGSPDFLIKPVCEFLNIENLSSIVNMGTGIVSEFCFRNNKINILENNFPNEIFNSFYTDSIFDDRFVFNKAEEVYYVKGKIKIKIK